MYIIIIDFAQSRSPCKNEYGAIMIYMPYKHRCDFFSFFSFVCCCHNAIPVTYPPSVLSLALARPYDSFGASGGILNISLSIMSCYIESKFYKTFPTAHSLGWRVQRLGSISLHFHNSQIKFLYTHVPAHYKCRRYLDRVPTASALLLFRIPKFQVANQSLDMWHYE